MTLIVMAYVTSLTWPAPPDMDNNGPFTLEIVGGGGNGGAAGSHGGHGGGGGGYAYFTSPNIALNNFPLTITLGGAGSMTSVSTPIQPNILTAASGANASTSAPGAGGVGGGSLASRTFTGGAGGTGTGISGAGGGGAAGPHGNGLVGGNGTATYGRGGAADAGNTPPPTSTPGLGGGYGAQWQPNNYTTPIGCGPGGNGNQGTAQRGGNGGQYGGGAGGGSTTSGSGGQGFTGLCVITYTKFEGTDNAMVMG